MLVGKILTFDKVETTHSQTGVFFYIHFALFDFMGVKQFDAFPPFFLFINVFLPPCF